MPQPRVMNFTDGVLMLSKHEIVDTFSVPIPSFIYSEQRLNIAVLEVENNQVYMACLSQNPTTYRDNVGSYVAVTEDQRTEGIKNHIELNEMQIERVINDIVKDEGEEEGEMGYMSGVIDPTVILMGDLGVGHSWHEENFGLWTDTGLESYGSGDCTFCVNEEQDGEYYNVLAVNTNELFETTVSKDLDHILIYDEE